jgi:hypothetical protein
VLLASGAAVPISQLRVGEKVLATDTRTGKTQAEAIAAVLVHHDSDLYDLKIRAGTKTSVIDTTSSHLFFVPGTGTGGHGGRWVKAGALKYGTHLRTPGGSDTATVAGGWVPSQRDGWMWDLTIPGNNDHDFYIDTNAAPILVHNVGGACPVQTGQAGENARIPDELNDTTVGEVKNVGYQYLFSQLRDDLSLAQQTSRQFNLYVRASTRLSGPLQDLVDSGDINRIDILP